MALLKEIADVQTGPFGSQLHKEDYVEVGTPIVTVEHLGNRIFTEQNLPMVSDEDKERLSKYILQEGDIVFSRVGSVDRCSYVDGAHDGWLFSGRCLRVRPNHNVDAEYLYYFFTKEETKQLIRSIAVGATMPSINTNILNNVEVQLPSLVIQRKIARVLSVIDKKIEVNNEINRNLQEQCDAIYKNMFEINFDDNWRVGYLSELITIKYGKDHKKLGNGNIPCYGSGGVMRYVEKSIYDHESVLIPRKGTLNNVLYVNTPFWSVDTMFYTVMKLANVAKFVYHFVKEKDLDLMNAGSAVPSMTTDILYAMELRIPSDDVLAKFEDFVSPLYKAISDNSVENKKLAEVRDTLLSKLMTGELDVSALEM